MPSSENKTIAKNTLYLYVRMLLLIFVQLYSVPVILKTLGVEDYGIYNVVGGIVTMFSFVGGSLASGSQRFLAYAIGKNDEKELKRVFDTTTTVYIFISILFIIILEVLGVWFLNNKMQIPENRLIAANWVFQLSLFSFVISLISIPYNSAIIAHEKMSIYAYMTIAEGLLKLLAAILLKYSAFDYLITYAIFLCGISLLIRIAYQIYCVKNFSECKHFKLGWNSKLGKDLVTYSGWNMIGSLALIGRNQGLNIVINLFFGPVLNAAHSIAQQVSGVLTQFINNIYIATRPRITKLFAKGNEEEMWSLVYDSSRFTFFLLCIICIPVILELQPVLSLWLGNNVPQWTYEISVFLVLTLLVETIANQIIAVFQAKNKIKNYQIISSTVLLLNIPLAYIYLKFFGNKELMPYFLSFCLSIIYVLLLLYVAKRDIGLEIGYYVKHVISRMVLSFLLPFVLSSYIKSLFDDSILSFIIICGVSVLMTISFIWLIGINRRERNIINSFIRNKVKRLIK